MTYPLGIAAFGITAALSGVCFTRLSAEEFAKKIMSDAGDRFLHSSLLLLQSVFIVYARDSIIGLSLLQSHVQIVEGIKLATGFILISVSMAAAWSWQMGYESVNAYLWTTWLREIKEAKSRSKLHE